ncbi:MAG: hypothetical protein JST16_15270 [Bdellovibrionales bacterium]|nr:hypothetical protein [Bdellovibrionales bacterium]
MKLLLRRGERSTTFGNPVYILEVRADLSSEERAGIDKYKFGKSLLYSRKGKPDIDPRTASAGQFGALLLHYATDMTVSVNDLVHGKRIECKDIMEMLAAEAQLREAATNFASVLRAASQFGGEEVVEL